MSDQSFRIFLFEMAEKLETRDLEGIFYIYNLPASMERQSALKVLMKLEMEGTFSASEPQKLEEVFQSIRRMDLVKKVKDYKRSRKKSSKTDYLEVNFYANVVVAETHARLLQEQIVHLQRLDCSCRNIEAGILEASTVAKKLQQKLHFVKEQHQSAERSCSESDTNLSPPATMQRRNSPALNLELQQHHLAACLRKTQAHQQKPPQSHEQSPPRSIYPSGPLLPRATKTPISQEECVYAEVKINPIVFIDTEEVPPTSSAFHNQAGGSMLVTGTLTKPGEGVKKKPVPPPKPNILQRAKSKELLEPMKEQTAREPEDEDDRDESGYAGTGDDQEFTDPTPFMKSDEDSPSPACSPTEGTPKLPRGYYKKIQRNEVEGPGYYKIVTRKNKQELRKQEKFKDEVIYQNSPNASASHNTL